MITRLNKEQKRRFARVRLLLCDVDGVLTDSGIWMGPHGEQKRFNVQDGLGIRLLKESGIQVGWISARPSEATTQRARDLDVDYLHQSRESKVVAAQTILNETLFRWEDVCYMGDDIVDLGMLSRAGLAVVVPHAAEEAKSLAHYVTCHEGGHGAVREVAELILKVQNKWAEIIESYSSH